MYAKINGETVIKFPYSVGQLRKDNPNVSFPKNITDGVFNKYGVKKVHTLEDPTYDALTQKVVQADTPTREITGYTTNEDATDPVTNEVNFDQVGLPIYSGRWVLTKTVVALTEEQIAELDAKAADANRNKRNQLLAATDYLALTDLTLDDITTTYRQALRDITDHANWPHLEEGDWPVKL
jgi:hypothetical protein